METTIIRYFFILFCTLYSYYKLINISFSFNIKNITIVILTFISSSIIIIQNNLYKPIKLSIIVIIFFIFITIISKIKISLSLMATIIAFGISYICLICASFFVTIIFLPFYDSMINIQFTPQNLILPVCLIQILLIYALFNIKRLRKGMPFLNKSNFSNLGIGICFFIVFYISFLPTFLTPLRSVRKIQICLLTFLALLLMVWWRRRITQTYIERIRSAELESLRKENEEKDRKIKELMDNNDRLAGIIHKDNKLLPAMESAVSDYLSNASSMTDREQKEYGKALLTQLEDMLHARKEVLTHYQSTGKYQSKTGIGILDGVCSHMEQLSQVKGVSIDFKIDEDLKEKIPEHVNEHDIGHLLSDLCTNAMHAVENMDTKRLAVHLGALNDFFTVEVEDSGMEFDISVYQDLGLERHTTHKETGGSGIGLMDIWKLKQKYGATLQIQEYSAPGQNFTKKISLIFDKKNLFLLYSYRYPRLKTQLSRNDLILSAYNFITSN